MLDDQFAAVGNAGVAERNVLSAVLAAIGNGAGDSDAFAGGADDVELGGARVDGQIGSHVERGFNWLVAVADGFGYPRERQEQEGRGDGGANLFHAQRVRRAGEKGSLGMPILEWRAGRRGVLLLIL
jgi:hypothetical protein